MRFGLRCFCILTFALAPFAPPLFVHAAENADYSETEGQWIRLPSEILDSVEGAGGFAENLLKGLSYVELKKGYVSPIGQAERAKIVKSVTARHGFIWVPRKMSTVIGRLEELLGYVKKAGDAAKAVKDAANIGKMIGIALGSNSIDEAVDLYVEEGMYQNSPYGEFAYWTATIAVGMNNGLSLEDAILSGYDEKNVGALTKLGVKGGSFAAWLVNNLPWEVSRRKRADEAFYNQLVAMGLDEKGQSLVKLWLSLDYEWRNKHPLDMKALHFNRPNDDGQTLPGEDAPPSEMGASLPDVSQIIGDVVVEELGFDSFVGPELPHRRILFLFSGDLPSLKDAKQTVEGFVDLLNGDGDTLIGEGWDEAKKFLYSTKDEFENLRGVP